LSRDGFVALRMRETDGQVIRAKAYAEDMTLIEFIEKYLDGKGALVEGASVASHLAPNASAPPDVTTLMRESFRGADASESRVHA
jgi:hypothetical protein